MCYGWRVCLALFAVVASLLVACTDRQPVTGAGPQILAPGTTAVIGLTVPEPGDYTMRISGQREDTAVLSVRPPGGR